MKKINISITEYKKQFGEILTVEQASVVVGVKPVIIKTIITREIIETKKDLTEPAIPINSIPRLKKIIRLHYDLGVGWNSMPLVLDLLDKIEKLEEKLNLIHSG